jgi:hypothetical protein
LPMVGGLTSISPGGPARDATIQRSSINRDQDTGGARG